jgi:hypothetical protein
MEIETHDAILLVIYTSLLRLREKNRSQKSCFWPTSFLILYRPAPFVNYKYSIHHVNDDDDDDDAGDVQSG